MLIVINGVSYLHTSSHGANVYVSVDRAVYVEVTVPDRYAAGPVPAISDAVAALPAVCEVNPAETDVSKLCTHRP